MSHRITWEEYKELVTKYNLVPNGYNASFRPNGEPEQHGLSNNPMYGKYKNKRCTVYHDRFGARVCKDLNSWYVWLMTKEDFEKSLIEMFKFLKDEQIKEKLNNLRSDFV